MTVAGYDFGDVDDTRRRTMQAIGSEDTGPEQQAREALDALGVGHEEQVRFGRYRPDFRLEDGTVLQVHGAFWHGHPAVRGMDKVESNEDYWTPKLRKNVERDKRRRKELLAEHGVPFVAWAWEVDDVPEVVEHYCYLLGLIDDTLEHRFWSNVEKSGFNECWEWQAATDRGYGHFHVREGHTDRASRVAYTLWYGDPGDRHVLHDCDNRSCCNPRHLHLGTHGDNMREAFDRGLNHVGSNHGQSKLDVEDVLDIRERYSPYGRDGVSGSELAREYDVSSSLISDIVRNKIWRWL